MFVCSLRSIGSFAVFAALALYAPTTHAEHGEHVGVFQGHQDVGTVLHPGSAEFDQEHFSYTIAGSGENMWFGEDDFQFAWRKMSGDASLTASVTFVGATGNNHRKGVLMIRKTLDGNSIASDLAMRLEVPEIVVVDRLQKLEERGALHLIDQE